MSVAQRNPYESPAAAHGVAPPRRQATAASGWLLVVVAAAAMVATLPGRTHGLGLVTVWLVEEFERDELAFGELNLWATLLGAAFCLPCGLAIDRLGARAVLTAVVAALGAAVMLMSAVESWPMLFVAVLCTRGFGQSMLSVCSLTLVGRAFSRRVGPAMGVYSLLIGLGFAAGFKLLGYGVLEFGWRRAWFTVGLALAALMAPLGWFLLPRQVDSREAAADPGGAEPVAGAPRADRTLSEALRSPTFWIFAVSVSLYGLISSGVSLFNQSILGERGFDAQTFHTVGSIGFVAGVASNLLGGLAATRLPLNRLLSGALLLLAVSLAALPQIRTLAEIYLYGAAMGLAGGVVTVSFLTVWRVAFGRAHLGRIQGAAQMLTVFASAAGPLLPAWSRQQSGSYNLMFYSLVPVVAVLGLAAWVVPLRAAETTTLSSKPVVTRRRFSP